MIRYLIQNTVHRVVNVDKLTYAGNLDSLSDVEPSDRYRFEPIDIADFSAVEELFTQYEPDAVMHLAAESHVDRSIEEPSNFINTNIVGTFNLLQASKVHWDSLTGDRKANFRFHHVSTDEVFGSLGDDDSLFSETSPYDPHSPYAASKASADHLVRAWSETYGLPVLITNSSNNYGPYQFPEKLVPVVILNAISGRNIPVYGNGKNVRDWLYVGDHVEALYTVLETSQAGETYNIGGNNERTNIDLVQMVCRILDKAYPIAENANLKNSESPGITKYENLITFVKDRPGHDMRYGIDATKIRDELGWEPKRDINEGIEETVEWYLENRNWWERIRSGDYQRPKQHLSQV